MKYKEELIKSMKWLGEKDNTLFLGQATACSGHAISGTLTEVPKEKLINYFNRSQKKYELNYLLWKKYRWECVLDFLLKGMFQFLSIHDLILCY